MWGRSCRQKSWLGSCQRQAGGGPVAASPAPERPCGILPAPRPPACSGPARSYTKRRPHLDRGKFGQTTQDGGAAGARAYLSNVCVARAARRRGVARALLSAAEAAAGAAGVAHLYVHVVADNGAASALYASAGFAVESEETEARARALQRPRRRILHKRLGPAGT